MVTIEDLDDVDKLAHEILAAIFAAHNRASGDPGRFVASLYKIQDATTAMGERLPYSGDLYKAFAAVNDRPIKVARYPAASIHSAIFELGRMVGVVGAAVVCAYQEREFNPENEIDVELCCEDDLVQFADVAAAALKDTFPSPEQLHEIAIMAEQELARAIRSVKVDTKPDTPKKIPQPRGEAVGLCAFLKRKNAEDGQIAEFCREYSETNKDCTASPESLERYAARYRHIWKADT